MSTPSDISDEVMSIARGCFCPKELGGPKSMPLTLARIARAIATARAEGRAEGLEVLPLDWREESRSWFRAPSELGAYQITHYAGMKSEGFKLEYGGGLTSYFNTLEAAKAAAQADYAQRILSAIRKGKP